MFLFVSLILSKCFNLWQASSSSLKLLSMNGSVGNRRFSVFNEFSEKMKGEANRYAS